MSLMRNELLISFRKMDPQNNKSIMYNKLIPLSSYTKEFMYGKS